MNTLKNKNMKDKVIYMLLVIHHNLHKLRCWGWDGDNYFECDTCRKYYRLKLDKKLKLKN